MFIDSHCHIDFPELAERGEALFAAMAAAGVTRALCVGVNFENIERVLALARAHPGIYASVGVHPENTEGEEATQARLLALAADSKVVAIGETGLDYYWHKDQPEWQRERFRVHIRAARACGKPLIVHTRDAGADTIRVLREEGADAVGGVMHCFTETQEIADAAIELGFYISFSGIVSFKSATALKDVARRVPLERMLIETDAPYLAPVPHRGKTNEPAFVRHVAEEIARLRELPLELVAEATTRNFYRLFRGAA